MPLSSAFIIIKCKKTCQFKTWCKGDKSNIKNSTDHFCEDTRQNALAALTNLGHVTPFLLLGPHHHLTIQWAREITSLDSKLPDQTVRIQVALYLHSSAAVDVSEKHRPQGTFHPMQNSRHRPIDLKNVFGLKGRFYSWANRPQRRSGNAYFTAWTCSSFDDAMGDFNEKIMLVSNRTV